MVSAARPARIERFSRVLRNGRRNVIPVKVMLVPNYSREDAMDAARTLEEWLDSEGVEVVWAGEKNKLAISAPDPEGCNLVVSLGGDGTLLRAARIVGYREIPVLGLSFGHLGFLTGASSENVIKSVGDALAGDMHASRRATLSVSIDYEMPNGEIFREEHFALNEVAISRGGSGNIIEFDVSVSGNHIDRLRGDGFVVATATGSTGYSLSAGGPIVTPDFGGCICVPVAPHTISARAFLTSPSDVVEISMVDDRPAPRMAFMDGRELYPADASLIRVEVRRGPGDMILLLDSATSSFYSSVSRVFYGKVGRTDDR